MACSNRSRICQFKSISQYVHRLFSSNAKNLKDKSEPFNIVASDNERVFPLHTVPVIKDYDGFIRCYLHGSEEMEMLLPSVITCRSDEHDFHKSRPAGKQACLKSNYMGWSQPHKIYPPCKLKHLQAIAHNLSRKRGFYTTTRSRSSSDTLDSQNGTDKKQHLDHHGTALSPSQVEAKSSLPFLDGLRHCQTSEDVLEFIEHQIKSQKSMKGYHITAALHQFQKLVLASLSSLYLSKDFHFRKKQIAMTESTLKKMRQSTSGPKWKSFMSFITSELNTLPLKDQAAILNSLSSLSVQSDTQLYGALLHNCLTDVELLDLQELVLVSDVCCDFVNDFVTQGKLLAAIHSIMLQSPVTEIDVSNLCRALLNLQPVIGEETLQLLSNIVKQKLLLDSSSVTPGALIMTYQCLTDNGLPYLQDLTLLSLGGVMSDGVSLEDLPVMGVSLALSQKHPWPISYLLAKVSACCLAGLGSSSTDLKLADFTKLSYCLQTIDAERLGQVIAKADSFLLLQILGHHMATGLRDRGTVQAYQRRLVELLPGLTQVLEESQWNQSAEVMLKFLRLAASTGVQLDRRLKEKISSARAFDLSRAGWDTPVSVAEMMLGTALDTLDSNILLSPNNLSALVDLTPRLDMAAMLMLYQGLDEIIDMPQYSVAVKKQTQKLRGRIQELFLDRLERAVDLPTSLALSVKFDLDSLSPQSTKRPGLFEDLLSSLGRFITAGHRRHANCLGALNVLNVTSKIWPLYQEELLESLTDFVLTECPGSPMPAVQLLRALASAGYLPEDFELFTAWLWPLTSDMLGEETLDKTFLVQMAYDMSALGLFHDEMLCTIFSLPFMSDLHEEIRGKPVTEMKDIHQSLVWLSRSVAIECPHLSVACLEQGQGYLHQTSKIDFLTMEKMVASIRRIYRDNQFVRAPSQSPYSHHIDAELVLGSNLMPVSVTDGKENKPNAGFKRLAFLYRGQQNFCLGANQVLSGHDQAVVRQLQILGYLVILLSHSQLSSMEIHNEQALDDLIRERINSAVGVQIFVGQEEQ